eukprot:1321853-Rhodomonas_salina.3
MEAEALRADLEVEKKERARWHSEAKQSRQLLADKESELDLAVEQLQPFLAAQTRLNADHLRHPPPPSARASARWASEEEEEERVEVGLGMLERLARVSSAPCLAVHAPLRHLTCGARARQ